MMKALKTKWSPVLSMYEIPPDKIDQATQILEDIKLKYEPQSDYMLIGEDVDIFCSEYKRKFEELGIKLK